MNRVKLALHEARRIAVQYAQATVHEAGHSVLSLGPAAVRILRARARFGVGPVYYSLYRFAHVPSARWRDYITDDPSFKRFLQDMSPPEVQQIARDKLHFYRHCLDHDLPTIPILGVVGAAPRADARGVRFIDGVEAWRALIESAPAELFAKPVDGTHGEDAFIVSRAPEGFEFEGRRGSADALLAHLRAKLGGKGAMILQPRMRPHATMHEVVSPAGLTTVRAITCMRNGEPKLLIAGLKIVVGRNVVDNFYKGLTGNLIAAIDVETGQLSAAWGSASRRWPVMAPFAEHPETRRRIAGFVLPQWGEIVALALRAQSSLPTFRTVGWDIAPTTEGPVLVEANSTYDVSILQIAHQRGLRRELMSEFAQTS